MWISTLSMKAKIWTHTSHTVVLYRAALLADKSNVEMSASVNTNKLLFFSNTRVSQDCSFEIVKNATGKLWLEPIYTRKRSMIVSVVCTFLDNLLGFVMLVLRWLPVQVIQSIQSSALLLIERVPQCVNLRLWSCNQEWCHKACLLSHTNIGCDHISWDLEFVWLCNACSLT